MTGANEREVVEKLREAARSMLPKNVCLTNPRWPDDTVVPLETTLGELRALSAALDAILTPSQTAGEETRETAAQICERVATESKFVGDPNDPVQVAHHRGIVAGAQACASFLLNHPANASQSHREQVDRLVEALAECERAAKQQMDDCHRAAHSDLIEADTKRGWAAGSANCGVIYRKIKDIRQALHRDADRGEGKA